MRLATALIVASVVVVGCVRPYRAAISSEDSNERILAIKDAGQAKDVQAVPLLVDRLEDEDDAVRFFAIIALEKITGRRLGYDYAQPSRERAPSIVRWREYVRKGDFAAAQPTPAKSSSSDASSTQDGIAAGP